MSQPVPRNPRIAEDSDEGCESMPKIARRKSLQGNHAEAAKVPDRLSLVVGLGPVMEVDDHPGEAFDVY